MSRDNSFASYLCQLGGRQPAQGLQVHALRLIARQLDDPANTHPTGITINPNSLSDIWIVDNGTDQVYQYIGAAGRTSGNQNAGATFALAPGNTNPQGIADPPPAGMMLPAAHVLDRVSIPLPGNIGNPCVGVLPIATLLDNARVRTLACLLSSTDGVPIGLVGAQNLLDHVFQAWSRGDSPGGLAGTTLLASAGDGLDLLSADAMTSPAAYLSSSVDAATVDDLFSQCMTIFEDGFSPDGRGEGE